jgi:hypothetical protein
MAQISPSLTCSLFDHKPVFLNLGAPNVLPDRKIFNSTLKNPLCDYVLVSSITDTYLNHSEPDTPNLLNYKNSLGRVFQSIREINRLDWRSQLEGEHHLAAERELLALQLAREAEALPGIETLNDFNLTTTPDIFFEILCGNLKNELLGFQGYLIKLENAKLNKIHVDIENLKTNYHMNFEEIVRLENMATSIRDQKLASRVSEMKIFENLHNEKATPIFLTLTKNKTEEKLSLIKDDLGNDFVEESDRYEFIAGKFEDLYRDRDPPDIPENIIEEFLGEEIVNSDLVRNSRLTADESTWLDRPLTIAELDISAKKGVPGADGFSNTLITRCWKFFRWPLYRYALYCYDMNRLTTNFKSARIKLIPKKGDLSLLKNWRPISLLSNFYKIISRAINSRLNRYVNRICSRSQKGYNNSRYAQEVLINVWEQVNYCKTNNINGAVVAMIWPKRLTHCHTNS